jgi:archaellum component FlaC
MTKKAAMTLERLAAMMSEGFQEVHADITGVKDDLQGVKDEMREMKGDIKALKKDVAEIKIDIRAHGKAIDADAVTLINHGQRIKRLEEARS